MDLLRRKIIYSCKVNPIPIIWDAIDKFESLAKKYGTKYLLIFKIRKEGIIHKNDGENDDDDASIAVFDDEYEEVY